MFNEGKATFFEKLNKLSDIPRDVFEKEKEGDFNLNGRAYGDIDIDPSEWYTHPDLERLYESRQAPPASFDATTKGRSTRIITTKILLLFLNPNCGKFDAIFEAQGNF